MSDSLERHESAWIELSLFYVLDQRDDTDPETIKNRALLIFGEGTWIAAKERPTRRVEKLGSGVKVIRIVDQTSAIQSLLTSAYFDHQKERFVTGLIERPLVVGLPDENAVVGAPFRGSYRLCQFICIDKPALLRRLAPGVEGPGAIRVAIDACFADVQRATGRLFSHNNLRWLGDVLIAERYRCHVYWRPIHSVDGKSCRELEVIVAHPATNLSVQVRVLGTDDMCLSDQLLEWQNNDRTPKRIQLQEELGTVQLRVWVDGHLVQEDTASVMRAFAGKISMGSGSAIALQDRLTRKLEKAIEGGAASWETLERATRAGGRQMAIGFGNSMTDELWSQMNLVQSQFFDVVRPLAPEFGYFPAQAEGRVQAILHFAKLISTADQAYLVDPWFDAVGTRDLVPRLSGDGHLTIVTNLPGEHVEQTGKLVECLESLARVGLAYQLEVICLSSPNNVSRQLFHDRYLLTRSGAGWRGFVLTNSFSGLATQYPLFVVEAPLGTTAQLLDEFETLVSKTERAKRLWPPERSGAKAHIETYRSFPYCQAVLVKAASKRNNDVDKLVQLGATRGFINLREDDWNWYSEQDKARELLDWLVPQQRRRGSRLRRRQKDMRVPRFDVGTAVHILGDLQARGLRITVPDVAQRTFAKSIDIEHRLRKTFSDPKDPTMDGPNVSAQRLVLRQTFQEGVDKVEAFRAGAAAWLHLRVHPEKTPRWDRTFAYAVLMQIDPERAVRVAQDLLDADFLLCLADPMHRFRRPWDGNLARALATAKSPFLRAPFLRAFGVQSFAFEALLAATPRDDIVPVDVDAAVIRLTSNGIPEEEIALILLVWGQQRPPSPTNPGRALGEILKDLSSEHQTTIFKALLDPNHHSAELLAEVVNGMTDNGASPAPGELEMLLDIFGQKFNHRPKDYFFGVPHNSTIAFVIGRIVSMLIQERTESAWDVLRRLMHADEVEKDTFPLSPFRRRPMADTADTMLGELILVELYSEGFDELNNPRPLQEDTASRVNACLKSPALGHSNELRKLMREIIDMIPEEALINNSHQRRDNNSVGWEDSLVGEEKQ